MKIVVSVSGNNLDSPMDPRFGRCAYFVFIDPDSLEFEAFANESAMASAGAGIQAGQFVVNQGAEAVITGHVGPNASMTLNANAIQVFLGAMGRTAGSAAEMYKQGQLQPATGPSVPGHFGLAQAVLGVTPGTGVRGGTGCGIGLGMGRGMDIASGNMFPPQLSHTAGPSRKDVEVLKSQIKGLQDQMERITHKFNALSKKGKSKRSEKRQENNHLCDGFRYWGLGESSNLNW